MKYLKVTIEGCNVGCGETRYEPLDGLTQYSEQDLIEIGQDAANEAHSWGYAVVDEDEVPVGDR